MIGSLGLGLESRLDGQLNEPGERRFGRDAREADALSSL